jgi:F0F1-type ATP synthase membrane subunit c/vacuolar-type H+-ATPase subunit K
MSASLRFVRIVHRSLLLSLVVYALLPEWVNPHSDHLPSPIVFYSITVMAVAIVGIVFLVRRKVICSAEALLANVTTPNPEVALRWRKGYVICFALCEAIGLYGLVLRFMGFSLGQVWPFYVAAIALMLYLRPCLPLCTENIY